MMPHTSFWLLSCSLVDYSGKAHGEYLYVANSLCP